MQPAGGRVVPDGGRLPFVGGGELREQSANPVRTAIGVDVVASVVEDHHHVSEPDDSLLDTGRCRSIGHPFGHHVGQAVCLLDSLCLDQQGAVTERGDRAGGRAHPSGDGANARTATPACSSAFRTARAARPAPGSSPWMQRVSTVCSIQRPPLVTMPPRSTSESARAAASAASRMTAPGRSPRNELAVVAVGAVREALGDDPHPGSVGRSVGRAARRCDEHRAVGRQDVDHHRCDLGIGRHPVVERAVRLGEVNSGTHRCGLLYQRAPLLEQVCGELIGSDLAPAPAEPGPVAVREVGAEGHPQFEARLCGGPHHRSVAGVEPAGDARTGHRVEQLPVPSRPPVALGNVGVQVHGRHSSSIGDRRCAGRPGRARMTGRSGGAIVPTMPQPPALTPEQRQAALAKAAKVRRERAEVKERLKLGSINLSELLKMADSDETVGKMKVLSVLESLPGLGKVKARRLMDTVGISESRRLQGLGSNQREALLPRDRPLSRADRDPTDPRSGSRVFVLFGPGGAGKGTIAAHLVAEDPTLWLSRSWTTRPRRPGEPEDAYVFVDRSAFEARRDAGGFFEWAEYLGNLYGTPTADPVPGRDVLLEIDLQGARQVRALRPDATLVLLLPPSVDVQVERLRSRGDSETHIDRRLSEGAEEERSGREIADHVVVNRTVDQATTEVAGIVDSCRTARTGE